MWMDWWAGMGVCRGLGHSYDFTWGNLNNFKSIKCLPKDHCDITLKNDYTLAWRNAFCCCLPPAKLPSPLNSHGDLDDIFNFLRFVQRNCFDKCRYFDARTSVLNFGVGNRSVCGVFEATLRFSHLRVRVVWSCGRAPSSLIVFLCCVLWRLTLYWSLNEQKVQF